MELQVIFDAVKGDGVGVQVEKVCDGRLRIEAVLHVDAHTRRLGAVTQPRVASLVDAVDPLEVERVAPDIKTTSTHIKEITSKAHQGGSLEFCAGALGGVPQCEDGLSRGTGEHDASAAAHKAGIALLRRNQ